MPLLEALGGSRGDGTVVVGEDMISWADLAAAAHATASELVGHRAVAVNATNTLDTVIAIAAGLAAGVATVPVPADAGPIEREHILRDSGATAVLGADIPLRRHGGGRLPEPDPDSIALIMYTSGTTGPPKGAMLSRRAIAAGIDGLADAWAWSAEDTLVHGLPLFHVHGLILGVLGPLRVGSNLVHTGRPTPAAYAAARGTMYFGVPTVWSRVCAEPAMARELRCARILVSGSAALPTAVFEELRTFTGHAPIERYGMSETLITVSVRADGERRAGYVGLPIRGVETRLVDDNGAAVPHDDATIGQLQVRGATMFDGYLNLPDAVAASTTADGWFRTGDAATIGADGFHRIVGRESTDIIKTGGYKVGAGEVEAALLTHPGVREAAVIGVADDDLGQRIVAYVAGDGLTDVDLVGFVAGRLSVHKRPREVRVIDALPRNAMGKVLKTKLNE